MLNWLVRSLLFVSSYLPMFPILILLHWDAHFAIALGAFGLILLVITLWYFGWQVRTMNPSSVTISEIAGHDSDTRPLRSNGTIHNGKKAEWPVEQVEGLVPQLVIRVYCLLSSSLSLEPARLKPPVKPKQIFALAAKFLYRCVSFLYSSEAKFYRF